MSFPPVPRTWVHGLELSGEPGSVLHVDGTPSLPPQSWTPLGTVSLSNTAAYWFDDPAAMPSQRFYRAWQAGTPALQPSLDLHWIPAITLTGSVGASVRVDSINRWGPVDAWQTLATVALTNTSQPYYDTSARGQPERLYRLVALP